MMLDVLGVSVISGQRVERIQNSNSNSNSNVVLVGAGQDEELEIITLEWARVGQNWEWARTRVSKPEEKNVDNIVLSQFNRIGRLALETLN